MDAIIQAHEGEVQMIHNSFVRVHQQSTTAKRGARSLFGLLARRPHDQNPCGRRQARSADQSQAVSGPRRRHHQRHRDDRRFARRRFASGRHGLRLQRAARVGPEPKRLGEDFAQIQSQRPNLLQQTPLPGPQPRGAVLQQDRAL